MYSISFIGAGNMAFRLSLAFLESGQTIEWIYNRTANNGKKLVKALSDNGSNAKYTDSLKDVLTSDIVFIAVSDDAIPEIASKLKEELSLSKESRFPKIFHTSGASGIDELEPLSHEKCEYGVFYPLMTLSKGKNINFSEVPFLLETPFDGSRQALTNLAVSLKAEYLFCDSQKRLRMHCAAVFSCNFTNYMLSLAFEVAGDKPTFLIPSAIETVRKAFMIHPDKMQTGPALRGDAHTMQKHLDLLHKLNLTEEEEIYRTISKNIPNRVKKR